MLLTQAQRTRFILQYSAYSSFTSTARHGHFQGDLHGKALTLCTTKLMQKAVTDVARLIVDNRSPVTHLWHDGESSCSIARSRGLWLVNVE